MSGYDTLAFDVYMAEDQLAAYKTWQHPLYFLLTDGAMTKSYPIDAAEWEAGWNTVEVSLADANAAHVNLEQVKKLRIHNNETWTDGSWDGTCPNQGNEAPVTFYPGLYPRGQDP